MPWHSYVTNFFASNFEPIVLTGQYVMYHRSTVLNALEGTFQSQQSRVCTTMVGTYYLHIFLIILQFIYIWIYLEVSKYRKQNTKFYHPPKNQRKFVHFFALASKKWLKQKIKALKD